jgi:hypothetical protein
MRVEFHEEAAAEYDAAFDWYLERAVRTPLLSSMLKLIVPSHKSLVLLTVGPSGRTRLASSYFDNSLLF